MPTQRQGAPRTQQIDQVKALEPFKHDEAKIFFPFDRKHTHEVRVGRALDAAGFLIDLPENSRLGHKNPYGYSHSDQGIFCMESSARIRRIDILDQAIAILEQ